MSSSPRHELQLLGDEELLVLMAHGDEQALGVLYDRYGRLVYSIALRIAGDRQRAEEITQDVFQSVWQQAAAFRASAGTVVGWTVGITRHRAIDELRSRRHKSREREVSPEEGSIDLHAGPGNLEYEAVMRGDVQAALRELPAAQRQAIELAYYAGLTSAEIASSIGASVGTVKTRLRLGLVKLRALFVGERDMLERGESPGGPGDLP